MNPNEIRTFSITFKTTNEAYKYFSDLLESYPNDIEIVSNRVLPNTQELYDNDPYFRKLLKASKDADIAKLDYINKHNK